MATSNTAFTPASRRAMPWNRDGKPSPSFEAFVPPAVVGSVISTTVTAGGARALDTGARFTLYWGFAEFP